MGNFDLILEKIGPYGRYQHLHYTMSSIIVICAGIHNLMNVFIQPTPEHWCHMPGVTNQNTTTAAPNTTTSSDTSCFISDQDNSTVSVYYHPEGTTNNATSAPCRQWDYDHSLYGSTAVTKWDLICTRSAIPAVAQSVYMVGFLLGALLFGYLSDRIGRRITLLVSVLGTIVFGAISAFLPEVWSHVIVRMFVGMFSAGTSTAGFVIGIESIGIDQRMLPGCCFQAFFAVGYMLLAGIAYLTRDFMWTNLISSLIPLVTICCFRFIPESPRWLMAEGRTTEAKVVLTRAAKLNGVKVDIDQLIEEYTSLDNTNVSVAQRRYTFLDLVRLPTMRKKSLLSFYSWFVISMVYYGLTMGVTDLIGSPYLNLFISGVVECAASVCIGLLLDRFGRRLCLAVVMIIAGVACVLCGLLSSHYAILSAVLSMIGKFGVSAAASIIYVFTAELNPTVVRSIGIGAGSMCARIGALLAPFIAQLRTTWRPLPTLVFGALAVSSGLLSLYFPETLGHKLPETLEEGERFGRSTDPCRLKDKPEEDINVNDTQLTRGSNTCVISYSRTLVAS